MRKRSRFRIKTIEFFVVYLKLDVPPLPLSGLLFFLYKSWAFRTLNTIPLSSRVLFFLYKSLSACTLNATSPFLTCFPNRRSPSACLEGTHGDRVAGDNTNAIDFVTIASSLRATSSTRIDCYRSLFMSLVRGRKESKLVRSLVLYIKLGVRFLAALRLVFRL